MSSIGAESCAFVRGYGGSMGTRLEIWQVPGIDGIGAMDLGLGGEPFEFEAVQYGDSTTVHSWLLAIEAMRGTVQAIVDDHGVTHTNMLIARTGAVSRNAEIGNGGMRGSIRIAGVKVA
jgi:hypothetical protein